MTVPTPEPIPSAHPAETAAAADPFRSGWRSVQRERPDGTVASDQIPLTREDLLHPEAGDRVTHSSDHQCRLRSRCTVLAAHLAHDPTAVVLDDVRIAWNVPDLNPHGPDIMVIFGVRERRNWSTFYVADEGTRPTVMIAGISPETRRIDQATTREAYDLAGGPSSLIVDRVQRRGQTIRRLLGYQRVGLASTVVSPDARGWRWLGIQENEVYLVATEGTRMGDYSSSILPLPASSAVCGHTERANRPTHTHFWCVSCGHTTAADITAAITIL